LSVTSRFFSHEKWKDSWLFAHSVLSFQFCVLSCDQTANRHEFNGELTKADFQAVVEHLLTRADVEIIACGKNSAYTLKRYDDA
ncbi:hypothetical protein ONR49_26200, partial [Salmonella enterica subsp. enterica serovar Virginia]|nr:hypothetical protein [Salmonella enterica subsp. enterica serovar Virginia]